MSNEQETVEGHGSLLTRRELLGASAALGTAAIASTSGAVGSASAQTSTEPRIQLGEDYAIDDNPDGEGDLVLEHLESGAQLRYDSSEDSWSVGSFSTDGAVIGLSGERRYVGAFDGADADARLDNALSGASETDVIYLERAEYAADRTISQPLRLVGLTSTRTLSQTTQIAGEWEIDGRCQIEYVRDVGGSLTINAARSFVSYVTGDGGGFITVSGDEVTITNLNSTGVTFESGTAGGLVDSSTNTSVTDNGSNTVGDIA